LTRSGRIESVHRGAVAVVDADGALVASAGAADQPCYFRSACKPLQVVPAIEAGIVERFGLDDRHVAIMVASHSGAPRHVRAVAEILAAADLGPEALGCGYHVPRNRESLRRILAGEPPSPLYNNCSGKHAGMLALARMLAAGVASYMDPAHPAQRMITARVADYCGISPDDVHLGTDGCSAPTLYAPLRLLAQGFARYARELSQPDSAATRVARAMTHAADMLGEEDSFQVVLSRTLGPRLVGKYGAEGLFCVAVPDRNLGIAVRVEDGAPRAIGPIILDILLKLAVIREDELGPLAPLYEITLKNWRGTEIGIMRSGVVLSNRQTDAAPRRAEFGGVRRR
jgi:L-asparaginase II